MHSQRNRDLWHNCKQKYKTNQKIPPKCKQEDLALCQKPQEAAIDFLIRVGTSLSNLGKDWKDELTDEELQSLQYEVSLNGVHEEIRHVLDSEIAKNGGKLTPQQMYEAVERYKIYVAHNKRLEGKGASSSTSQPKAVGHTSGYKLQFHKTTAFAATIPEVEDHSSEA